MSIGDFTRPHGKSRQAHAVSPRYKAVTFNARWLYADRVTPRGIIVTALVLVSTVSLAAGLAAGGRLPFVSQAWDTTVSAVAASLDPPDAAPPPARAASGAGADAAAPHRQAAPLSSAQLGAPLVRGTFVTACGAPDTMKVVVKATVKMGHAIDVTVKTDPANTDVALCVERATRAMQWDISPKVEHVTVTY